MMSQAAHTVFPSSVGDGTKSANLTDTLVEAIVSGALAPESKISEPELAKQYQVSRGPLREAMMRLEGLGLIERVPHVGARVVAFSVERLGELYDVREGLEGMAARLAAKHITSEQLAELDQLITAHERYLHTSNAAEPNTNTDTNREDLNRTSKIAYVQQQGDYDFHYRIIQASGNAKLISLLCNELYHLIRMYRNQSRNARTKPSVALQEHKFILEAIRNRDGELAEMLMRRHISGSRRLIEAQLSHDQLANN